MDYLEMMNFRHACKVFDNSKKISQDDFDYILEACRLSPSSFGMQPWKIVIIKDENQKANIKPMCWNQAQIDSCSHLCIIVGRKDIVEPSSEHVRDMFGSRGLPQEQVDAYIEIYTSYINEVKKNTGVFSWVSKQCYILLGNMLNASASRGIDSCPIEGFEKSKLESYLGIDTTKEEICVVAALGYRLNEQSVKNRLDINKIIVEM